MNPIYHTFHEAMNVGEENRSPGVMGSKKVMHWSQHLLIAGTTVATVAAVALAILTQHPLAIVCGVICLENLIAACYLRRFPSPEIVEKLVNPLAEKIKKLFEDLKTFAKMETEIKVAVEKNTQLQTEKSALEIQLKQLRSNDDGQKAQIALLQKEKSKLEGENKTLEELSKKDKERLNFEILKFNSAIDVLPDVPKQKVKTFLQSYSKDDRVTRVNDGSLSKRTRSNSNPNLLSSPQQVTFAVPVGRAVPLSAVPVKK